MADDNRWSDRDRDWRDDRRWQEGRGGSYGARGQGGGRGYRAEDDGRERWRQMHADRRHEGPAGYNDSGPIQGGWEFGDREQGGERGQGYRQMGYGRRGRPYASQGVGHYDEYGRDPGVGSGYGESWASDREYGRGGGYGASSQAGDWRGADRGSYDSSSQGAGYGAGYGLSQQGGGYGGARQYGYGAHTPYGYRGRNEYDDRGRGGQYADDGRYRDQEDRSWLERAGEKVAGFFGADDEGRHRGRGPRGYRRSDDRIREDISDRLTDDPWLDASDIDIEVRECEVILKGEVASREDKRRAEDIAEAISGVRNVQNHLRMKDRDSDYDGFGSSRMMGEERTNTTLQNQSTGRTGSTPEKDQKGLGASTSRQAASD